MTMDKYTQIILLLCACILSLISSTSGSSSSKWVGVHNSTCNPKKPNACDDTQIARQNRYKTYLKCSEISKKCVCEGDAHYDSEFDICRIKVKSLCPTTKDAEGFQQACTKYAICAFPLDKNGKPLETAVQGSCQCTYGYATTVELTCSSTGSNPSSIASNSFMAIFIGVLSTWIIALS